MVECTFRKNKNTELSIQSLSITSPSVIHHLKVRLSGWKPKSQSPSTVIIAYNNGWTYFRSYFIPHLYFSCFILLRNMLGLYYMWYQSFICLCLIDYTLSFTYKNVEYMRFGLFNFSILVFLIFWQFQGQKSFRNQILSHLEFESINFDFNRAILTIYDRKLFLFLSLSL